MMHSTQSDSRAPLASTATLVVGVILAIAICLLLVLMLRHPPPVAFVRVRNASTVDFHSVVLDMKGYGDVGAGQTTPYQGVSQAYKDPGLQLEVNGSAIRRTYDDHIGDAALGPGYFTYTIEFSGEPSVTSLTASVEIDSTQGN